MSYCPDMLCKVNTECLGVCDRYDSHKKCRPQASQDWGTTAGLKEKMFGDQIDVPFSVYMK